MMIDEEGLKKEIKERLMGAFVGGGFGAAYVEATVEVDALDTEGTKALARRLGIDPSKYVQEEIDDFNFYR